jgi:uncharacterized protein (TIGR03000 family)
MKWSVLSSLLVVAMGTCLLESENATAFWRRRGRPRCTPPTLQVAYKSAAPAITVQADVVRETAPPAIAVEPNSTGEPAAPQTVVQAAAVDQSPAPQATNEPAPLPETAVPQSAIQPAAHLEPAAPPTAAPPDVPQATAPQTAAPQEAPATIELELPSDAATVMVDGRPTQATGVRRTFITPPLPMGRTFTYEIGVEADEYGVPKRTVRQVEVRAGESTPVKFESAAKPELLTAPMEIQ